MGSGDRFAKIGGPHSFFAMELQHLSVSYLDDQVDIPYMVFEGHEEGPTCFVSGGMHGNEINGIASVERFIRALTEEGLGEGIRGKIFLFPVLNPTAFAHMQRKVFEDKHDLNRSFGYEEPSTLAQAMANELTDKVFQHCRFGIDLHDAGKGTVLTPHTRVLSGDHPDCEGGCTREMGQIFGTQLIIEREGHPHMLAPYLHRKHGVSVITVETGGAQTLFPEFIEQSLQGIKNVLIAFGMMNGEVVLPQDQFYLTKRLGFETDHAGILRVNKDLGDFVHDGEEVGSIYYPQFQKTEHLMAPMCGYLFAKWQHHQIPAGKVMYAILETKECHIERTTLDSFTQLPHFSVKEFDFSR